MPVVEPVIEEKEEIKEEAQEAEQLEPFAQQRFMTQAVPDLSNFKTNAPTYDFDEYDFEEEEEEEDEEEGFTFFRFGRKKKK